MNTPSTEWDAWYSETHGDSNKATWELDEEDIPEHDLMDDPYE